MKRSKRQENGIIIHFVFYFVTTAILLIFVFTSILPKISEIEESKQEVRNLYTDIKRIEKEGLSFKEFTEINNSGNKSRIVSEIIKSMDTSFYTQHLINDKYNTYTEFLTEKEKDLNSEENTKKVEEKTEQLSKILPSYTDTGVELTEDSLSDYKFINYVESILQTFNLSTNNPIGINKINILKEFVGTQNSSDPLDSNLFYIPLNLTIEGKKEGIIEFLYFIENVGNINADVDNISINDAYGVLYKNNRKVILEGDKFSPNYNIFENQIIDIERITMSEYIDSSYLSREEKDFKEFIISDQGDDEFEITLNLMFYVKGQPLYKIEEFILSILDKHKEATALVASILKDTDADENKKRVAAIYNKTLAQLSKTVISIRKELSKKDQLESLYQKVLTLDKQIDPIFNKLKE